MLSEIMSDFFQRMARMRWSDYLDIILVAFLIYYVLQLIRTTNAIRIFKVVAAVILVTWITELAQLNTLNFLVNQILTVGLVALVVLFQPELRRMIDHLGSVNVRDLLSPKRESFPLEIAISQTVAACEYMSREKIGALIVFARGNPLDEFFKTGTVIDAQVSDQLIRNIFFPKAALHDGAMIIRDGRVAAAGCVLPLSDSERLSADLGTRHRAGVGASEASDAVVVIVSEETGTISVAMGGMLKRHLAAQTLERLLRNELCGAGEDTREALRVRLRQRLQKKEGGKK